ncbi:hypothetical protein ANCCAN_20043 [Ancylostoma caninum]|uniref:FAM20 C-terminal domain-containing protein n=1 Tax=Ancylostoma caninum TaxID=29170 RepID=A0A368FTJ3_ANCCA|nr:hypothetical protein ANCCAN_20043 [Ancylostoma caninum]
MAIVIIWAFAGNQDRHHYESFAVFENLPSYAIHLDNGRANEIFQNGYSDLIQHYVTPKRRFLFGNLKSSIFN